MSIFFFDMLYKQEKADIRNKTKNIVSYIEDQAHMLKSTLYDWAKWDDTYYFVTQRNREYIALNLNAGSIKNLNLSFIAYYDGEGREIYKLYYDSQSGSLAAFPGSLSAKVNESMAASDLAGGRYDDENGILADESGSYIIAKTGITDSALSREPAGVMFVGRKFDAAITQKIRDISGGGISFLEPAFADPVIAGALEAQIPTDGIRSATVMESGKTMTTYIRLELEGEPAGVVLAMTSTRDIFQAGLAQHNLMLVIFLLLIVLVVAVLLSTLNALVSKPFTRLINAITNIRPSANSPQRLEVKGKGELALLSGSINDMLDNIDANYKEIDKREMQFNSLVGEMKQGFAVHEVIPNFSGEPADCRFIYANESYKRIMGLEGDADLAGLSILKAFPASGKYWLGCCGSAALAGEPVHAEKYFRELGKYLEISIYRPQPMQCAMLLSDITERHLIEEEREYTSYHDQLTGLHNRRYFEEAMRRLDSPQNLPLSVIIGDVNGLKFTNDAFGHETGDKLLVAVAEVLRACCREGDVVARWGGDEFTLLLPKMPPAGAGAVCARIKESISKIVINSVFYSISLGFETKVKPEDDLIALLKHAEDGMYRRKMTEYLSSRGNAIHAIMATFQERNEREKEHSIRVSHLCRLISEAMGFSGGQAADMEIAGMVHDIGKIAVSDAVINKKGRLTDDEWAQLKKHPEIGYRILCASNEMLDISQYILAHHERWDGAGYPKGLAGKEIPLQARILAVADAYDAMTSARPYKDTINVRDAVAEIKRCAGVQFDPAVARVFVEKVLGFQWYNKESAKEKIAKIG